jgi:head-tail adaptor
MIMRGKPGQFHLAELRDRIHIQEATETLSNSGQPVRTWANKYISQPAKYMPTAGTETLRGRSVEAGIAVIFTVRNRDGITPQMQVVHTSGTYGIVYVKPVDGMPIVSELHCRKVADNG